MICIIILVLKRLAQNDHTTAKLYSAQNHVCHIKVVLIKVELELYVHASPKAVLLVGSINIEMSVWSPMAHRKIN